MAKIMIAANTTSSIGIWTRSCQIIQEREDTVGNLDGLCQVFCIDHNSVLFYEPMPHPIISTPLCDLLSGVRSLLVVFRCVACSLPWCLGRVFRWNRRRDTAFPNMGIIRIPDLPSIQRISHFELFYVVRACAWLAAYNPYYFIMTAHGVTRPWTGRWPHILKGMPATAGNSECSQVSEIGPFFSTSAKNIHYTIYLGCCVTFAGAWNIPYAIQLRPSYDLEVILPDIVEPCFTISTPKSSYR